MKHVNSLSFYFSESAMLNLFKQVAKWRKKYVLSNDLQFRWTDFHISIVGSYFLNLSMSCNFPELPSAANLRIKKRLWDPNIVSFFIRELQEFFVVPTPNKFHESENGINKYQLVEAFLTFLLQLLYHKPDSVVKDRIEDVENELRFLHTILGDSSLMQCDEHEEFQKLLPEFESVVNAAGRLVHTIFFSVDPATGEDIAVVLNHVDRLNANLMKFLHLWPTIRGSAYITPTTSVVDSFLIVDSLIHDLDDVIQQEDSRITDVEDQIKLLHQGLILLKSLIKDTGSPRPSEIEELEEPLMRIGDMAREAEYLVTSFLVGDAPLWYFITRLEEILVEYIYKTLKGRRYLIVIDDVWELNVWDDLRRCFPDDGNGSRILLTSRIKDVAPINSIIHEMPFLLDEQCWELLEKKVFGGRPCPPELQEIGKRIGSKCCGLPLTVVVIAGILSTVDKEESMWEEVGQDLTSYIDGGDDSVMRILELSYKHLPDHLKPCFLHFGIFEEDEEILVRELMRFWISEGFIRKENEKNAETIAEEYLIELIDKSLVMVTKRRSDGGVKACGIHDLLRDLCLKISNEENFLKLLESNYHTMHKNGHRVRALQGSITLSSFQRARSFYGINHSSPFYVRDMKLLRVLHFSRVPTGVFFGIEYLHNLRYLVIWRLPASIDTLVNLEYLRVVTHITIYLAPAVLNMMKLRYFKAEYTEYDEDWNSSQENNLEFLSNVTIKKLKDEEMLKHSPHLRRLKCTYEPRHWERKQWPHFDLSFLTQLVSLHLDFELHDCFPSLEEFRFPKNITKLTISDLRLPWEKISIIGSLENLEVLKIEYHAFEGERWETRDGEFQKLRFLKLDEVNFTQWNVDSSEHFPKLQQLVMSYCTELQAIPSEIGEITTLQLIEVKGTCPKALVESAERIRQEQRDMGNEELRVIIGFILYSVPRSNQAFNSGQILSLDDF